MQCILSIGNVDRSKSIFNSACRCIISASAATVTGFLLKTHVIGQ